MREIIVADMNVIAHNIVESMTFVPNASFNLPRFVEAHMTWVASGRWLQGRGFTGQPNVIWCNDTKPYWRTEYLKRESVWSRVQPVKRRKPQPAAPIHYKGKRAQPTVGLGLVRSAMRMTIAKNGWHILEGMASSVAGYEADDMAALIVALNRMSCTDTYKLYLLTCDHDWIGLVDAHTTWCNTYGHYPRLRNLGNWNLGKYTHLKEPKDLWEYKAQTGDTSDNLPNVGGNPEGTAALLPVISLLEPPSEYNPLNDTGLVQTALGMMQWHTELTEQSLQCLQVLERSGVQPCMKPVIRQSDTE